jgi:AhpD family alkylhydroperoxidase
MSSRIELVGPAKAGPFTKQLLRSARRQTKALAGRETDGMIEPVEAYAHLPGLLVGYGMFEGAQARQHRVPKKLKVLAELKAATMTTCEYCIDIGSQIARRSGVSDEQLLALPRFRESGAFDAQEKLVLEYAVAMSRTPVEVSDELFALLREQFDDAQIVELTSLIALENMRGRFNLALGFGSSGLTEGMVCAAPEGLAATNGAVAHAQTA